MIIFLPTDMQSRSSARKAPLTLHFYLISLQVQAFIDCFNNKIATANCVHKGSFEKYLDECNTHLPKSATTLTQLLTSQNETNGIVTAQYFVLARRRVV